MNNTWMENSKKQMGRLRIWVDDDTKAALDFIRGEMRTGPTRTVSIALSLLWFALLEKKAGRKLITVDKDGNNPKDVM